MANSKPKTHPNITESNPNAVSVRIEPKTMSKAKFQRRHDFRIGAQPAYVDGNRTHLNRLLIELRPLPDIQRENEALRMRAGRTRKMKSNAAVVTVGVITFGHKAQAVFNRLPDEVQNRAFTELVREIAAQLNTSLEALVVQRYAPAIERGNKKKDRLEAGADYPDTLHRSVKQLHEDLPREKAALEAEIATNEERINEQKASLEKTQRYLEKLKAKKELTEKEIKRKETYRKRLEKKQVEMAAEMKALDAQRLALSAEMAREVEAINVEKETVKAEREKTQEQTAAARRVKEAYEKGVNAIEAVLSEAEKETLSYDPDSGKTTMDDPTPLKAVPPKLRTKIVAMAKRLAFVESSLFARIFRLDAQVKRIKTFLSRTDISPEARQQGQAIVRSVTEDDPSPG